MTTTARRLFTPVRDGRDQGASRREGRPFLLCERRHGSREAVFEPLVFGNMAAGIRAATIRAAGDRAAGDITGDNIARVNGAASNTTAKDMAARNTAGRNTALRSLAAADRTSPAWPQPRASAVALGRWWPVLLVLALGWVAWLNAPGDCALEESAWREADAHLTRLMIRAHRSPRPASLTAPVGFAAGGVEQQAFALQVDERRQELLRAKRELEGSLAQLRMCRQER